MPFVIGVTGGIGSGKSAAANCFAQLGAGIVDTDEIAHRLTRPGGAAIEPIRSAFGAEYIDASGALDRARMRSRVFSDPGAKERLERIVHPLILSIATEELGALQNPYALLVVPLLVEGRTYLDRIDRVLVVDCREETQIARTMQRSKLAEEQVRAIMANQATRAARLAAAHDVIDNDGDFPALQAQVEALHRRYLALADEARR